MGGGINGMGGGSMGSPDLMGNGFDAPPAAGRPLRHAASCNGMGGGSLMGDDLLGGGGLGGALGGGG